METSTIKTWADLLTGPFAALMLAVGLLYVVGSYMPTVIDRHFASIDRMMDEHAADRAVYQESMRELTKEIGLLNNALDR